MKNYVFCLLLAFISFAFISKENKLPKADDVFEIYIFMHQDCRICQYYSLTLNELQNSFASDQIVLKGVFPAIDSNLEAIKTFKEKYNFDFELLQDQAQFLTKSFDVTVTPEVIVYHKNKDQVLYKGRIDDSYVRVGKRKRAKQTAELKDILTILSKGEIKKFENKAAVGCLISLR